MHGSETRAPVIDLALLRPRSGVRATLILRVSAMKGDEEIYRYLGVDESSTLDDVARTLVVAFGISGHCPVPAGFTTEPGQPSASSRISAEFTLGEALEGTRSTIFYHWGLWRFELELVEAYPRDDATPPAVCIAGAGDFGEIPLNITAINRELIGDDTAERVLRHIREEARDVIVRSSMYDFVLLLEALDLGRDVAVRTSIRELPRERTRAGRDAFWSVCLALTCLADAETTDLIITTTYDNLGYPGVSAQRVRELCSGSLVRLAGLGVYGEGQVAPVARLDIFRELFSGRGG